MIEIMNLKESQPSEPYDFYIDRRSPVGNPFPMRTEKQRGIVCDYYDDYFKKMIELDDTTFVGYLKTIERALEIYGTVRLFCWCTPKRCHGETIFHYLVKNKIKGQENGKSDTNLFKV